MTSARNLPFHHLNPGFAARHVSVVRYVTYYAMRIGETNIKTICDFKNSRFNFLTRKSITCYYMLYKGVATCYLNLLVISSCCFDTNSEMFLMIHLYQIAQLTKTGHYIFKQLSESVAQIMSQKMFLKTP